MEEQNIDLSILIPALNEAENLRALLPELQRHLDTLGVKREILIVDGGSRDGTVECARSYGARVVEQKEPGYGRALREGFAHAKGRYVVTMDADFSHRPVFIEDFWRHREEADLLIASRYVPGGSSKTGLFRKALSIILNRVYTRLLDLPFEDISSGFRMYRRAILQGINLEARDFDVLEEVLIKAYGLGFKIKELPFQYLPRDRGRSHVKLFKFAWSYLKTLFRMWQLRNSVFSADYDERAFRSLIPLQRYWHRERYRIIMGYLEGKESILDIGCGSSRIIQDLPEAVGLDILLRTLRYLRDRHRRLVQATLETLPFKDASFETVICSEVIEHIPGKGTGFAEMGRVLKEGGLLILGTPDYSQWLWRVLERVYGLILPGAYAHQHITHYTRRELEGLLSSFGFDILECRYVGFCEMIFKAKKRDLPFKIPPSPLS